LEIVFVSSDRDQRSFQEYYNSMPWTTVSFQDRSFIGQMLMQKYGQVSGIPTLMIVDGVTGNLLDRDAVRTVGNARGSTARALSRW
jgi:nucleoredoxin